MVELARGRSDAMAKMYTGLANDSFPREQGYNMNEDGGSHDSLLDDGL